MTSLAQTKAIHALRRSMPQFTEGDYRALLLREFRKTSSKELTFNQAGELLEMLKALGGKHEHIRRASETADGPYAGKLRALWIAAHNLGLARSRDDKAMLAYVKRMTRVEHTRFLTDAKDAAKAIEGLKAWLARDGGVEWPTRDDDAATLKYIICKAVARRCFDTGAFTPFMPGAEFETVAAGPAGCWPSDFVSYGARCGLPAGGFKYYTGENWDDLARRLGARLRLKLAKTATPVNPTKQEAA